MTIIIGCPVSHKVWHAKEPSLLKGHECRIRQNVQPFIGNGDVSIWSKNSLERQKTIKKQKNPIFAAVIWPGHFWYSVNQYITFNHSSLLSSTKQLQFNFLRLSYRNTTLDLVFPLMWRFWPQVYREAPCSEKAIIDSRKSSSWWWHSDSSSL